MRYWKNSYLMTTSISDKINIAVKLIEGIIEEKERILIEDKGAIVQPDSTIVSWFVRVTDHIKHYGHLTFCIESKFRANKTFSYRNPEYYFEEIPELNTQERRGLLKRYATYKGLDLSPEDLRFFQTFFRVIQNKFFLPWIAYRTRIFIL